MRRTIVVGSGGQDGRLLTAHLEREGSFVLGIERDAVRSTEPLELERVDILAPDQVRTAVEAVRPDEVYYLAAYHQSAEERPPSDLSVFEQSLAVNVQGLLGFLQALKDCAPSARLFYASSCHVFGPGSAAPLTEETPLAPDSPYAISKAAGMASCRCYRERHGLFASSGVMFNHESPLRGPRFLSQKIVRGALEIQAGLRSRLILGDLEARVDWGYAPDFVDAMVRMLRLEAPQDFVIATGELHSVSEFLAAAFGALGLEWRDHVQLDPSLVPRQGLPRWGDSTKLRAATGWAPSVTFEEMVRRLVEAGVQESEP